MGRTVPTYRNVLDGFEVEWREFQRGLRRVDQEAFEELLVYARRHATAGTYMTTARVFEPVVMSVLVEHEKRLRRRRDEEGFFA